MSSMLVTGTRRLNRKYALERMRYEARAFLFMNRGIRHAGLRTVTPRDFNFQFGA